MSNAKRCKWAEQSEEMRKYHDEVWGKPERDETKLYKMLVLEMFQAGLSWNTILQKEKNFEEAFENFDIDKVANFDNAKIDELLKNDGIIRHKMKIESAINNAKIIRKMHDEGKSFSDFIWSYVIDTPIITPWSDESEVPSNSFLSDKISEDMKSIGFKFVGSTVIYSFLQAIGVLNDHILDCDFKYED